MTGGAFNVLKLPSILYVYFYFSLVLNRPLLFNFYTTFICLQFFSKFFFFSDFYSSHFAPWYGIILSGATE